MAIIRKICLLLANKRKEKLNHDLSKGDNEVI